MEFYRLLASETWRLTMESAFVKSGILWAPFPFGAAVLIVLIFVVCLFLLGRSQTNWSVSLGRIVWSLLYTTGITLAGLLVVIGFEALVYAPYELMNKAVALGAEKQRAIDTKPPINDPRYMTREHEFEFSDYLQKFRDPRSHVHLECIDADPTSCDIAERYRDRFAAAQWATVDPIVRIPAANDVDSDPKRVTVLIKSEKWRPAEATALYRELPHVGVESGMKLEPNLNHYDLSLRVRRKTP